MTSWVSRGLDNTLSKSSPTDYHRYMRCRLSPVSSDLRATHPLTWAIAYFGIEGMARACAALTDTVLGVFPLYLLEKIYSKISRRAEPEPAGAVKFSQSHISSYVDTMKEKVVTARLLPVPDELCVAKNGPEEILEIRAWCAKPDWTPPRTVRYEDRYYRLEESAPKHRCRAHLFTSCGVWRLVFPAAPFLSILRTRSSRHCASR